MTLAQQLNITQFPFIIKDDWGNITYFECAGYWSKNEYDSLGNVIYLETSSGLFIDDRVPITLDKIASKYKPSLN